MDFITKVGECNAVWVINMAHFVTTADTVTPKELAGLFSDRIYKHHGLPKEIVSDRG